MTISSLFEEHDAGYVDVPRDRWKRPLIKPVGGGKLVGYARASSFGGVIEDRTGLEGWQQRMVAVGLSRRPDLQLAVTAHVDDKKKLNDICKQASEAAAASSRATIGTAVHSLTELADRGEELPPYLAPEIKRDLDAYRRATVGVQTEAMETFCVCDELQVAGTFDRLVRYKGKLYIADVKTGSSVDLGAIKIAVQLAVYGHSVPYDIPTAKQEKVESRRHWPGPVDQDWALVIHLPAGEGVCTLRWIDIRKGWQAAHLSRAIRDMRKIKGLYQEWTDPDPIAMAIAGCASIEDTRAAYMQLTRRGYAKDIVLAACLARNKELESA